ncbi:hypothetical protein HanXRQr2_Chr09g0381811 [Helianthus annuus]|uniref:Uncharacterized protein n=1 Tax=Helianthus annuus TaxID=4232 RepID=A0A251TW80_HELAN|nr:uncharacterized protein LOC110874343 [Helianthus annuus]KAF5790322.1 hypothetical protein HanXRQr2_Chr09g0381811 [Helianthus annuus]
MENMKHQSGGSSFTETLFGPKDGRASSSGHFGSVFGPSSMGLGHTGSSNKQNFGNPKQSRTDCKTQKITETAEPSYYSSSIYYGGQDVYPQTSNNNCSQRPVHRGGGVEDPNGSSASRGNWWQGSLYY